MKIICAIPARYNARRFPGKLLKRLGDKTIIEQTYLSAKFTNLFDDVFVVTDNKKIYSVIEKIGGKVVMSSGIFESGTDRIASALKFMDADIILNIQGDEPFINKNSLSKLLNVLIKDKKNKIDLASLMVPIKENQEIINPNNVKVVVDKDNFAIYFSRHPIPYNIDNRKSNYFKHIGVYAFRKNALIEFSKQIPTNLEKSEKIECLRYIENGKKIKMITTNIKGVSIDTPSDLDFAKSIWNNI
tara:strand:- start:14760 stop:15491 length:732 start_codon:yes stop_codon:yes gene_type:complete